MGPIVRYDGNVVPCRVPGVQGPGIEMGKRENRMGSGEYWRVADQKWQDRVCDLCFSCTPSQPCCRKVRAGPESGPEGVCAVIYSEIGAGIVFPWQTKPLHQHISSRNRNGNHGGRKNNNSCANKTATRIVVSDTQRATFLLLKPSSSSKGVNQRRSHHIDHQKRRAEIDHVDVMKTAKNSRNILQTPPPRHRKSLGSWKQVGR
ncbi:hypothetical protein F5144DRAFT_305879 [Chaetomium tenue]|uniref:Uncharacterized protein n=1 Tax=Chaetomium tenue TaxID=1854479 RepID=A0ACB7P572_9PEZI|nr:hypothetical protein F5144DRAFT_305879 [Chaetomium globosum]